MVSPKTFISSIRKLPPRGFTLFEVLIVMSMLAVLAGVTMLFSVSFYQRELLRAEHNTLIMLLQTARAMSMQNKTQVPHGLAIDPGGFVGYVLFSGTSLASADSSTQVQIPRSSYIVFSSSAPVQVVFSQLSGDADYSGNFYLIDKNTSASTSLTINYEGAIY